ncbi:MAG: hypothetical protein P8100_14240 [bacterium]
MNYFHASNQEELNDAFGKFMADQNNPALLEIHTPTGQNSEILRDYFALLKKNSKKD